MNKRALLFDTIWGSGNDKSAGWENNTCKNRVLHKTEDFLKIWPNICTDFMMWPMVSRSIQLRLHNMLQETTRRHSTERGTRCSGWASPNARLPLLITAWCSEDTLRLQKTANFERILPTPLRLEHTPAELPGKLSGANKASSSWVLGVQTSWWMGHGSSTRGEGKAQLPSS